MRLGEADLSKPTTYGTERKVAQILTHPKYLDGKAYFDVGIAVADRHIEFTNYIRPICLPMRPGNILIQLYIDYKNLLFLHFKNIN
jgi:hypothetical protein